jgi:hypothetical protein
MINLPRHCRFPISDFRLKLNRAFFFNRQWAIGNRKSPGLFLAAFARAGLKRAPLLTLSQLTTRAALKRTLIRTQTGAPIDRQNALNFSVRTRNDVNTDQFADSTRGGCSGVCRRLNRANVSANKDGHVSGADIFFSQELNICSFDHCISGFDGTDEAFGLHHSECF